MTICFVCDLGRHYWCSGYSRSLEGPREPCTCDYPMHPKSAAVVEHPPAPAAASTP